MRRTGRPRRSRTANSRSTSSTSAAPAGHSRSWTTLELSAGTSSPYRAAAFVPVRAGLTASTRPLITYSWKASLTYGVAFGVPHNRSVFVSLSVNSSSGAPSQRNSRRPSSVCSTAITAGPAARSVPFSPPIHQVLRNHSDGSRWIVAASALRLATVMRTSMSSGSRLAYSTSTSTKRLPSNTPVSISSYSGSSRATRSIGRDQVVVRVAVERIAIAELQIRARRRGVEVEVVLLDVLAVVALGVGEPEHPLLEDRVGAVPHGDPEAQMLVLVAHSGDAVLTPHVRPRARLVVGEVAPRVAVVAVVLAHGAPLALAEVRPPSSPWHTGPRRL